jgi:hypothetical protein
MQHHYVSSLVESGTRRYVRAMLHRSHRFRARYYNTLYNLALLALFAAVTAGILYYMRTRKETAEKKRMRQLDQRNYVIDKLNQYNRTALRVDGAYNAPLSANNPVIGVGGYAALASDPSEAEAYHHERIFGEGIEPSVPRESAAPSESVLRALGNGVAYNRRPTTTHETWMRGMEDVRARAAAHAPARLPSYSEVHRVVDASLV